MKYTKWVLISAISCFALTATLALADGHGQGNGKDHDKKENGDDGGDRGHEDHGHNKHFSKDHDRLAARSWYDQHQAHLPPGLAKKDQSTRSSLFFANAGSGRQFKKIQNV
jgi:hypothetical protein